MSTTNAIEIEIHIDEQNGEDLGVLHFVLEYGGTMWNSVIYMNDLA